ncbi:uncharacterized protein LOC110706586 isoform X4 [Chenopodium quinoa]|uniref:uncharacterized protein LOC110706586 isoform X4 n=1 Tax=Chenopodium quinoa TaxID=63459 RepID=UPI000B79238A|nr:uncharacterized protein LOC110706586 isoform X4 [Chenopodium quinoa]
MASMAQKDMESTSNENKTSMRNDARDRLSELPDDILVHILSFLPILDAVRTMSIRRFDEVNEVRFTARNIEKLDISSFGLFEIDCPNLKILNIHLSCREESSYLRGVNIPSVHEVHLQSIDEYDYILNKICKVEVVKFSEDAFQGMLSEELSMSSPCVLPLLKTVTIRGYRVACQSQLRLAECLLKSCVTLEKMVILPSTYELVAIEELKFVKRLCSFPRASANARVIYGSEIY